MSRKPVIIQSMCGHDSVIFLATFTVVFLSLQEMMLTHKHSCMKKTNARYSDTSEAVSSTSQRSFSFSCCLGSFTPNQKSLSSLMDGPKVLVLHSWNLYLILLFLLLMFSWYCSDKRSSNFPVTMIKLVPQVTLLCHYN